MNVRNANRYQRQGSVVPSDRINDCKATVIGVGAIGRNVALQLASIGIPQLQIVDFDIVEETNIVTQGYLEKNLGEKKVEATGEACRQINGELQLEIADSRFKASMDRGDIIFCCVDSMEIRELIWKAVSKDMKFFVDSRMSAETLRVLTVDSSDGFKHYPETLFPDAEAFRGACTAKSTIYCANIAAGFLVSSFTKWLRNIPNDPDVLVNLVSNEIIVAGPDEKA